MVDPEAVGEAGLHIAPPEEDLVVHDCRVVRLGNLPRMVVAGSSFVGVAVAVAAEVHEERNVLNITVAGVADFADRGYIARNIVVEEVLRV